MVSTFLTIFFALPVFSFYEKELRFTAKDDCTLETPKCIQIWSKYEESNPGFVDFEMKTSLRHAGAESEYFSFGIGKGTHMADYADVYTCTLSVDEKGDFVTGFIDNQEIRKHGDPVDCDKNPKPENGVSEFKDSILSCTFSRPIDMIITYDQGRVRFF